MNQNHNIPAEIAKFDQLETAWWDTQGDLKTLHHINPARVDYIKQHCPITNKRILDVGCGGGILSESLAKLGAMVTGIDQSAPAIAVAKAHAEQNDLNIDYLQADINEFAAEKKNYYDAVVCMELIEHIDHPEGLIATLADTLKPGGFLFVSTLNRNLKAYLMAVIGAEYVLRLLPRGTHDYAKFIKPSELARWARAADLTVRDISGIHYQPWKQLAYIAPNTDVNYVMCLQKVAI